MAKNTIFLWYNGDAEAAAASTRRPFGQRDGCRAPCAQRLPGRQGGRRADVEFTVAGISCVGLNGGPMFKHSEAFSFQIATDDQQETDRYWNAIVGNGGQESACGWCKDKWGISWQITPRVLTDADGGRGAEAKRAFAAMMDMRKIDVAAIERRGAADGQGSAHRSAARMEVAARRRIARARHLRCGVASTPKSAE